MSKRKKILIFTAVVLVAYALYKVLVTSKGQKVTYNDNGVETGICGNPRAVDGNGNKEPLNVADVKKICRNTYAWGVKRSQCINRMRDELNSKLYYCDGGYNWWGQFLNE